ncbi:hypothetical protein BS17DRAFT_360769 [Gyrodon lividus]|nr:hypothetical protein BS17DRAFT_360769 [Gyrodon lividus]
MRSRRLRSIFTYRSCKVSCVSLMMKLVLPHIVWCSKSNISRYSSSLHYYLRTSARGLRLDCEKVEFGAGGDRTRVDNCAAGCPAPHLNQNNHELTSPPYIPTLATPFRL